MFVVAIAELAHALEEEAVPLAASLGLTAFDVRTRVAGVLPKVIAQFAEREGAERALASIRARGHGASMCDVRDVMLKYCVDCLPESVNCDLVELIRRNKVLLSNFSGHLAEPIDCYCAMNVLQEKIPELLFYRLVALMAFLVNVTQEPS